MSTKLKSVIINKGTGAGGMNTTINGNSFENKTDITSILLEKGYEKIFFQKKSKHNFYFKKTFENKTVIYTCKNGFSYYMKKEYNIDTIRLPDEAYIILYNDGRKVVKILEKKTQNVEGTVEDKLKNFLYYVLEYKKNLGIDFEVEYAYTMNNFLKKKVTSENIKYKIYIDICAENKIKLFYGDDTDYFDNLISWFQS